MNFVEFLVTKNVWSLKTFGDGQRAEGILKHIESELDEIRENPDDLMGWVDVVLLALDGAFRAGHSAYEIVSAIYEKQKINTERVWDISNPDEPNFHKE